MRYEGIKSDIFDINRDMPTGPAVSFCSTRVFGLRDSGPVDTCHGHMGGSSSPYYLLIQCKT